MEIKEFIKHTGIAKLIIGNGFDLHCGIHTAYSDYYCKNWKKYRRIQQLLFDYENNHKEIDFSNKEIDSWNVWDIFFAINSSEDPHTCKKLWCEIERLILSSLISEEEAKSDEQDANFSKLVLYMASNVHWPNLFYYVAQNTMPVDYSNKFMVEFIKHGIEKHKFVVSQFYEFILEQLGEFEKSFGSFIYCQTHSKFHEDLNPGRVFLNTIYYEKVNETIQELCQRNNMVEIDSFNYSPLDGDAEHKLFVNYINGSYQKPIFGIDSCFEPSDQRFIFTKTSRRMESRIIENNIIPECKFDSVIVYGHSLDSSDYSYFFPIFDQLKLLDNEAKGRLIFAFSIFDASKEQIIQTRLREDVSKMLFSYAKEKMIPNPNRFLDSISTQKRVLFYEIPVIPKEAYRYRADLFEEEWKKAIKEMDKEIDCIDSYAL